MAAQYAGWQIAAEGYFAMGSGPMRAAAGKEPLFERIGHRERPPVAVGVLEATEFPPEALQADLARRAGVEPDRLTLLAAPTASLAGTVQVVARSVETALHKLDELGFDLARVVSGWGTAPLPPVGARSAHGARPDQRRHFVWRRGNPVGRRHRRRAGQLGPRVPSSASADHGQPFAAIFARYEHDFYRIDPHLFSPAVIRFVNLASGPDFSIRPHAAAGTSRVVRSLIRSLSPPNSCRGRMRKIIEPGSPPHADRLALFADQLVSPRLCAVRPATRHEIVPLPFRDLQSHVGPPG